MKLRRTFVVLMTLMCVFAMVNVAFAANRVEVKVTSEPMPEPLVDSSDDLTHCHKGGGFSLEFDTNTQLVVGDQIYIDLPRTTGGAETVTLCRAIDLVISETPVTSTRTGGGWTQATLWADPPVGVSQSEYSPLYYFDDGDDDDLIIADDLGTPNAGNVYFTVTGTLNSQRIIVTVAGTTDHSITVGDDQEDRLVLQFLDQKTNIATAVPSFPGYTIDGVYVETDGDNNYDEDAAVIENTLCLNAGSWVSQSVIKASIDTAIGDKFTYIPSDPQIAHYISTTVPVEPVVTECKAAELRVIDRGEAQGAACIFDYERSDIWGDSGYCDEQSTIERRFIVDNPNGWDIAYDYTFTFEILVAASTTATPAEPSVDSGVYWTEWFLRTESATTTTPICEDNDDYADLGTTDATSLDGLAVVSTVAEDTCAQTNRSRRRITVSRPGTDVLTADGDRYLWIDFPRIAYNSTMVQTGQVVSVRVTIGMSNPGTNVCGSADITLGPYTRQVGVFGNCGRNQSLVYPYLAASQSEWVTGLTFANMSDASGAYTINYYESDGDMATATGTLAPMEQFVGLTYMMVDDGTLVPAAGNAGVVGDQPAYAIVCAAFDIDGFSLLNNLNTTVGYGVAQGYTPRQPMALPEICE